jgi:hypothetical protein
VLSCDGKRALNKVTERGNRKITLIRRIVRIERNASPHEKKHKEETKK